VYNSDGTKTSTGDLLPETTIQLKLLATSTESKSATKEVEDFFNLKISLSACVDNKIAFDPSNSFVYANHHGTSVVSDVEY
jgi:hypothetical protein